QRFIANHFASESYKTKGYDSLYKTGDLVSYLPVGNLEYLGRIDNQVKIRGFRIELGEIEAQLSSLNGVSGSLVLAQEDVSGQKLLIGYVVAETLVEDEGQWQRDVKKALRVELPDYMVPAALVVLEEWPLTPNGKIDRKALPAADFVAAQSEYLAPVGETETTLVNIWSELLGLPAEDISASANFFELGGHSLLALKLINLIEVSFDIEAEIMVIFEFYSLKDLASYIQMFSMNKDISSNDAFENFQI
ncbi:MAG: non-ribosomal peptide synthetase, partial [Alteromonadaceae bacterium]|nr:non-ribosomal peptide synthetase [Alteromonadaceae bacterium]